MQLDFKEWLDIQEKFEPAMRDVRFGYDLRKRDIPSIPGQVGSDFITGMGSVFRKRMGAAFPGYGQGHMNYFDDLMKVFTEGNYLIVVRYEPIVENASETELVKVALNHIQNLPSIQQAAEQNKVDLNHPDKADREVDSKLNALKVTFWFRLGGTHSSQRILRQAPAPQNPGPTP